MKFTKMHGLENDYVYINTLEERVSDPVSLARVISDRHQGVGSDGLILIGRSHEADLRMEMYNADGSRGQMCGNGIRCVAKYAFEHGLTKGPAMRIETDAGVKTALCDVMDGVVQAVRIDMGQPETHPRFMPSTIRGERILEYSLMIRGEAFRVTCVSMGNPHAILFVDDPSAIDLPRIGALIEHAPEFPERINVHFVRAESRDRVCMRTWERGSGITRACGTGACAVCVAGVLMERTDRRMTASLPGGDLQVEWSRDNHVYMTGPAVEVFTGDWPD